MNITVCLACLVSVAVLGEVTGLHVSINGGHREKRTVAKCKPQKPHTKCTIDDTWQTLDTDGDGHVDSCDNCPNEPNENQADNDHDRIGDDCDHDIDTDEDGISDGIDNCLYDYNQGQHDIDGDGLGDVCDNDDDGDGKMDDEDNCQMVPNHDQKDTDWDGIGDACQNDADGDCVPDHLDICPNDPKIHEIDFRNFHSVSLDATHIGQPQPSFAVSDSGDAVTERLNSKPGVMIGEHVIAGLDFAGTFRVEENGDDDYIGFVFGYKNANKFYAVMWKKGNQHFWECNDSHGEAGVVLKKAHANTGPSKCLADALWSSSNTLHMVTVLWKDPIPVGWEYNTNYHWDLVHRPKIGLIRFKIKDDAGNVITDSGDIIDEVDPIQSGHFGVYCHSQENVSWSNLKYKCNDASVHRVIWEHLSDDKQKEVSIQSQNYERVSSSG